MDAEDPWNWNIDRVVAELCAESRLWSSETVKSRRRPNFVTLEKALRDQEIDGSTLLTAVDDAVLKNELGIRVLGQLAPVKQIIWDLRLESAKYSQWLGRYGSEFSRGSHLAHNLSPARNIRKRSESPALHYSARQGTSLISPSRRHTGDNELAPNVENVAAGEQSSTNGDDLPADAWVTNAAGSKRRRIDAEFKYISPGSKENDNLGSINNAGAVDSPVASGSGMAHVNDNTTSTIHAAEDALPTESQVPVKPKKRIAPINISSAIDMNRNRDIPTEADCVVDNDPQNIEPGVIYRGDDGKKRLIPLPETGPDMDLIWRHQEQLQSKVLNDGSALHEGGKRALKAAERLLEAVKQNQNVADVEALSVGYLGNGKFLTNSVFYNNTAIGKDLPSLDDEDDRIQLFTRDTISDGRRRYVHGIMKRFLRCKPQIIRRDGKSYYALRPYATKLAPQHQAPSFTLLRKKADGEIHASREIVTQWPELEFGMPIGKVRFQDYDDRRANFDLPDNLLLGGADTYSNWDPDSLDKYRYIDGGEVVLPLYGDSDEEGEYDLETWKEIEAEHGTVERPLLPLKRTPLSQDEVNAAVDEGMAQIVVAWHEKRLPKLQRRAWTLWKKSRKKSQRRDLTRKAKEHVERINNQRLPQMREEFLRDRWVTKKQVLRVTKAMELTIYDREDCLWQISVMKSKEEPPKPPPREPKLVQSTAPTFADGDDGECIMSGPETQSYDEGDIEDDSFIDDAIESTEEARHSRADDEADNYTMSDRSNSERPTGANEAPSKAHRKAIKKSQNSRLGKEENQDSGEQLKASPASRLDDENDLPQKNPSISPRLPLRLSVDRTGIAKLNVSPNSTNDYVDLTIISSDISSTEKSPGGSTTINLITPEKRKNKVRLVFKRESSDSSPSSDLMEVSQGTASNIPHDFLTLTDPAAIARIPRSKWEEVKDNHRLLVGDLYRIIPDRKKELSELFGQLTRTQMWSSMVDVMHAFCSGKDKVQGMDSKTYTGLTGVMRLFETYALGKSRRNRTELKVSEIEKIIEKEKVFPQFHQICRQSFDSNSNKAKELNDEEDEDPIPASRRKLRISSGSESQSEEVEQDTPHKTRKKTVFENAQARDLREQDRQRLQEQEQRRRILQAKLAQTGLHVAAGESKIIINDAKHDEQGFVNVAEQIAKRIKGHQIDGVRFMWSQIVTNGDVMQGCLLAHTMGLGKTMQVITLLVAIAQAAKSPDPSVSSQIPPSLGISKTLILCPPGLIDNWMDELLMWAPQGVLGEYRKSDASLKGKNDRLGSIETWYTRGGILIMSYEMFRKLIHNNSTEKTAAALDEEEHAKVREHLLQGPNIIVADEAHRMKNANASITQAAAQFRSRSRIALTGSPLANNVEEYHTMIEWIAPNYLGPIAEFRAKYVEPIQQGSYSESTPYERRQSLKMLRVLREDLEPKVHRADISVLRQDLKPKTEFVITVPLTDIQHKAYSIYVRSMLGNDHETTKDGQVQLSTLWHWLAILSLLCNHPTCFKDKLLERKDDAEKKIRGKLRSERTTAKGSTSEDDDNSGELPVWKVGVSEELVRQEMALFQKFGLAVEEFHSSNKVKILLQILDASKAVGDKVLIFSQSIPTLNFLERLCKRTGRKYGRLDGTTKIASRQGATKEFNTGETELYLISTTAGGIGLNLPGANRVIIFDFKFNPVNEEQAVGRAYRIGQQKPVFVYRFVVGGTFEECIHNTTVFKMQLASKVVDKKNPLAWAKKRTGEFLFEPRKVKQQDLSAFKAMDPFVLDKILDTQEKDSTIRAIVMTDTFERHDNEDLTAEDQKEVLQLILDERLKRTNKPLWEDVIRKRHRASLAKQQPSAGASSTPMQVAQRKMQNLSGPALGPERPPAEPRILPPFSIARPLNKPSTPTIPKQAAPELTPIAGVNTKIRDSPPPSHKQYYRSQMDGTSAPSPSNDPKTLAWTPDHKRSLSGDQPGSDAADRLLRVAIRQYSRNLVTTSESKRSENFLLDLAISVRKEIEKTDPTKLKEYVEAVIGLFSTDRTLADSLVSGKLSASAIVMLAVPKSGSVITETNVLNPSKNDSITQVSAETRQKVSREVGIAIHETLSTVSGCSADRTKIAATSMDLVKILADKSKDLESFEAAKVALLIEVSHHETSSKLVTGATKPIDLVKGLIHGPIEPQPLMTDGPSESPKSPLSPTRSTNLKKEFSQSPQSKTELAYFERVAKRRSRLPSWALSDIEKAKTGNSTRQPPSRKSQTPSRGKAPIIDLT